MKTALVTGANRGIGFEIVKQLADHGFTVWLTARHKQHGTKAMLQLKKAGRSIRFLQLDVSDQQSIAKTVKSLKSEISRLNVLINNAGVILKGSDDILTVTPEKLEETFRINSFGPLWLTQACVPLLDKGSRVINISSGSGEICSGMSDYAPVYSISKTTLNAVTCQLALALNSKGVYVNAVCPGWVKTDMGGAGATRSVEKGAETPVWMASDPLFSETGKFFRDKKVVSW
jgi:NAD(P)-dependent dehydrogenase (short-subunit alcohol dehydrogenase family)